MGRSENSLKPGCVSVIAGSIPRLLNVVCTTSSRPLGRVSKRCQKRQVGHQAGRSTLVQGCSACRGSACLSAVPEALDAAVTKNNRLPTRRVWCGYRAAAPLQVSAQFSKLIRQIHGAKIETLANHTMLRLLQMREGCCGHQYFTGLSPAGPASAQRAANVELHEGDAGHVLESQTCPGRRNKQGTNASRAGVTAIAGRRTQD